MSKIKNQININRIETDILWLKGIAAGLMGFGVVMVYSAQGRVNQIPALADFFSSPAGKQVIFVLVSLILISVVSRLNVKKLRIENGILRWIGFWIMILAIVLSASVYFPLIGLSVNGARRWLKVGPVSFQPSEFAKFSTVIFLAGMLAYNRFDKRSFFKGLVPLVLMVGIVCGLIGKEDFGTAALIALVAGMMLIAGGAKLWQLTIPLLPAIGGFAYLIIVSPYRLKRLTTFLNIWKDPQGAGYHAIQSLISIGNGGWWGKGLGEGLQKYGYLPEDTTDFIFSIICEELGAIGGILVIVMMMLLVILGWRMLLRVRDDFSSLLIFGLISTIGLQGLMNVAVTTVSIPTKGIALPFISAGGSGLIFASIAIGLICGASRFGEGEDI